MKVLDLFSGIGGFSLGLESAGDFETIAFCEIEEFCQAVLSKNFPGIPIFADIKNLTQEKLNELGKIDVITGGFPCQPYSNAGSKKAFEDDRDLWPEMFRVIKQANPTWIIGENVAEFVNVGFTRTKVNLESIGYTVQPFTIPACAIGAQHKRDRVWIIAHFDREGFSKKTNAQKKKDLERIGKGNWWPNGSFDFGDWWSDKSRMGRAVYGILERVDEFREQRVKALGNSIVPGIATIIGRAIFEVENEIKN